MAVAPTRALEPASHPWVRAEDIPVQRRTLAFLFLMAADFFYGWAWNTVDVLRPFLRESLNLTLPQAGTMYSAQGMGALVGAVVLGQVADRRGRRNVLFFIMVGYSLSLLAGVAVRSYAQVLGQRFVLGIFLGGVFPIVVGTYVNLFDQRIRGRLAAFYNGTFNGSVVVMGAALGLAADRDWRLLFWAGALPPLALAFLTFVVIPDDRRLIPFGHVGSMTTSHGTGGLPIAELFRPDLRRRTLLLTAMVGLNFFGYQAFSGWVTVFLRDVRHLPTAEIGTLVAWQFSASIAGGFFWGWFADRFGRRPNAIGFVAGAIAIVAYLTLPSTFAFVAVAGMAYGFAIASSVIWGPWIAELYPAHLRSTAASIFNWGRIISFFAPIITGAVGEAFGLSVGMMLAALSFTSAAGVWWLLPETLERPAPIQTAN